MRLDDHAAWTRLLANGQKPESGSLRRLLLQVMQSLPARMLPPRSVFNAVLQVGRVGGGMSGGARWKAGLLLSPGEYASFRDELPAHLRLDHSTATTLEEWTADVDQHRHGVDRDTHLLELRRLAHAEASLDPADFALVQARQRYLEYITAALAEARTGRGSVSDCRGSDAHSP